MPALHELVAARMVAAGITTESVAAFMGAQQAREVAAPRFKALKPQQREQIVEHAARLLRLTPTQVVGQCADVFVYPDALLYVWSDTHTVLVDQAGNHLLLERVTPYWEQVMGYAAGQRT